MKRLFKRAALIFAGAILLSSCSEEEASSPLTASEAEMQIARVSILNAFSATNAAITSIAFQSEIIESVNGGSGSGGNPDYLKMHREWMIRLKDNVDKSTKQKLGELLQSLERCYDDLNRVESSFKFTYTVSENESSFHVKASCRYDR